MYLDSQAQFGKRLVDIRNYVLIILPSSLLSLQIVLPHIRVSFELRGTLGEHGMREHTANLCSSLVHFSRLPVALLVICIAKMSASFVHRIYPSIPWTRRWCVIKQITLLVLVLSPRANFCPRNDNSPFLLFFYSRSCHPKRSTPIRRFRRYVHS